MELNIPNQVIVQDNSRFMHTVKVLTRCRTVTTRAGALVFLIDQRPYPREEKKLHIFFVIRVPCIQIQIMSEKRKDDDNSDTSITCQKFGCLGYKTFLFVN
jgi:hypothetical protein